MCDFIKQYIPRPSATFHVAYAISKLESRGSVSQILSSEGWEFHKFIRLGVSPISWGGELPCHSLQGWVTWVMLLTYITLAFGQLQAPQKENCLLILEGRPPVP